MIDQMGDSSAHEQVDFGIPARLDRLPWGSWHLRVVIALGVTWLLDGLEGSLGGSVAGVLKLDRGHGGLGFTDSQLGISSSLYLFGAVLGALGFGYLADRLGRRRVFFWTLLVYVCATAATGLAWNLVTFTVCRVLTGAGIGGEYAAINSAVDELMPARLRGRIDLWINGTFWLGIILGSIVTVALLSHPLSAVISGWRLAFCSGVPIGIFVLGLRKYVPESPRWLLAHGEARKADHVVRTIEAEIGVGHDLLSRIGQGAPRNQSSSETQVIPPWHIVISILLLPRYRRRAVLCLILMTVQAFFYNSVFFSLSLVLMRFYAASVEQVGNFFIPIAIANFLGPLLLGRFFDTVGRRGMIAATYCLSGIVLIVSSFLFLWSRLTSTEQVGLWAIAFFFASTSASSAYLTVSEVFPQQVRATAIAIFYAIGTFAGGVTGPFVFGRLVGSGQRSSLVVGYIAGAAMMLAGGIAAAFWAVDAEGKSLEEVAIYHQSRK